MNNIDITDITNDFLPEKWECPHCNKINSSGMYANDILPMHGKVILQCGKCGNLHLFRLKLTEDFKKKVVDFCKNYSTQKNSEKPLNKGKNGNL